jgi:hypothetical protein
MVQFDVLPAHPGVSGDRIKRVRTVATYAGALALTMTPYGIVHNCEFRAAAHRRLHLSGVRSVHAPAQCVCGCGHLPPHASLGDYERAADGKTQRSPAQLSHTGRCERTRSPGGLFFSHSTNRATSGWDRRESTVL